MKDSAVITIPSHPHYLSVVRDVTGRIAEIRGLSGQEREAVTLAVYEACSNVIKYAYLGAPDKEITITFKDSKRSFEVVIDDKGMKADPELIRGRALNDVKPGGLGIHLIKKAFDVVEFDRERKEGNRLRLIKHRDRGSNGNQGT